MMNDLTDELPACAGGSGSVIPAPGQGCRSDPNDNRPACQAVAPCPLEQRRAALVELLSAAERVLRAPVPEDEARAAAALAELDRALAEHGAPDPERTAAWLAAGAPVRP
jgi:hypothetical protein